MMASEYVYFVARACQTFLVGRCQTLLAGATVRSGADVRSSFLAGASVCPCFNICRYLLYWGDREVLSPNSGAVGVGIFD